MVSANTLCKRILNVNNAVVENCDFSERLDGVKQLTIFARPNKWHDCDCPICHRRCPRDGKGSATRSWRALDWGGIRVNIVGKTHRIDCPEHGSLIADIPWAYPGSRFTKDFDLTVGWLAIYLSRSTIAEYMQIDWKTVGRCVSRTLNELEPERSVRLNVLVNIGIDETSYKKGHRYITVIGNHDTNTVVWAHEGHGKSVLTEFFKSLTPEQLSTIKVVTGDGAQWITDCVNEFTTGCERCVDPFHVVEWAMEALDEVRREAWREAYTQAKAIAEEHPQGKGRPKKDDPEAAMVKAARKKAEEIKGSTYVLGKAPENLTDNQRIRLEMIANTNNRLYRAYMMKEELRLLLKLRDQDAAEAALKKWMWRASHSRIDAFKDLYQKIKRHKTHILNTIRLGMSNARIEATNNKIKLIIRKAYGFRNTGNMLDMVYLVCSNLRVPLPNRKPKPTKSA